MSHRPASRSHLLIRPKHEQNESLRGYVARVSMRNGSSPLLTPMLKTLEVTTNSIQTIATLTGCSESVLKKHGSFRQVRIGGPSDVIFGNCIFSTDQIWLERRMVCPMCLSKKNGVSSCCWELREYDVCHTHGHYLASRCSACNQVLSWASSTSTTCICGYRLKNIKTKRAPPYRRELCALVNDALSATINPCNKLEIIHGALTPLDWFLIFFNFIRSVLLPDFCEGHLESAPLPKSQTYGQLLLTMLKDKEYCRHLRQVIFLHAADDPMTMAQRLRLNNFDQEKCEFFAPCLDDVVIHDALIEVKLKLNKKRRMGVQRLPRVPGRLRVRRPESHSFQLQAAAFLSAIDFAYSDKR